MSVAIVDPLEIVDVEDDGRQAAIRRDDAGAGFGCLLEETPAVAQPGQRVGDGDAEQFALHGEDTLGGAQSGIELLGERGVSR
ncbi:MAG TPA: hypothetical protein VFR71_03245 [Methyloceanibacter sp.]|nr:hypothetical protein [Methyloceanibacter sp.]